MYSPDQEIAAACINGGFYNVLHVYRRQPPAEAALPVRH